MKILYICRLYSGFEDTIINSKWCPNGAPTIYKMIEYYDTNPDVNLSVILTDYGTQNVWDNKLVEKVKFDGIGTSFFLIPSKKFNFSVFIKFNEKIASIYRLFIILKIVMTVRPDIVYLDRVNIVQASFLARFTNIPVVWRVMGVLETMHTQLESKTWRARWLKWLWRSPFKAIICTLDGSEGESWVKRVAAPNVRKFLLLNGYDGSIEGVDVPGLPARPKVRLLFVARLEALRGVDILMDAINIIVTSKRASKVDWDCVVAGYGSKEQEMKEWARAAGISHRIFFTGKLTPFQLKALRMDSDIFINCGTHGNLSNTLIEALAEGLCIVVPQADYVVQRDVELCEWLEKDVGILYGPQSDARALAHSLEQIITDPDLLARQKAASVAFASKNIKSWHQRCQQEYELILDLLAK